MGDSVLIKDILLAKLSKGVMSVPICWLTEREDVFPFFWQVLFVPIVRTVPQIISHKNVVKAWEEKCSIQFTSSFDYEIHRNYKVVMNKALQFN